MTPTPFRMTAEDMAGADAKLRAAIQPVLDALNITLNDVVSILQGGISSDNLSDEVKTTTFDSSVDVFPYKFSTKVKSPRFVSMAIQPEDPGHVLTTPFVMQGYSITSGGLISIPAITGILASNKYTLTFWIRGA